MTIDPSLPYIAATAFVLAMIGLLFDYWKQPIVVAYLLAGVILGPGVLGIFDDPTILGPVGGTGLILLLFFVGLEVDLKALTAVWRVALFGTVLQTAALIAFSVGVGLWLHWSVQRIIIIGFVMALACTPIALRVLNDRGLLNAPIGNKIIGILVVQDLLAIPMFIVLGLLQGSKPEMSVIALQVSSAILLVGILILAARNPGFKFPLGERFEKTPELQVLAALSICFGFAMVTGLMQLSVVLGGFIAGMLVRLSGNLQWARNTLDPFNHTFVALFFVSVGVLIDINFLSKHLFEVLVLTAAAMVIATALNTLVLIALREPKTESAVAGASLSQLGEFGFVLAALGLSMGAITENGYQFVLSITAVSWLLSPAWITLVEKIAIFYERRASN